MAEINRDCVQTWPYIPINAFLYFPQGTTPSIQANSSKSATSKSNGEKYSKVVSNTLPFKTKQSTNYSNA